MFCEQIGKLGDLSFDGLNVHLFLDGNVEQGSRVPSRGGSVRHNAPYEGFNCCKYRSTSRF